MFATGFCRIHKRVVLSILRVIPNPTSNARSPRLVPLIHTEEPRNERPGKNVLKIQRKKNKIKKMKNETLPLCFWNGISHGRRLLHFVRIRLRSCPSRKRSGVREFPRFLQCGRETVGGLLQKRTRSRRRRRVRKRSLPSELRKSDQPTN